MTRREDGPICRRCYVKDPLVVEECVGCGKTRSPSRRLDDGTALCSNCIPRPERECTRCGTVARHKYNDGGAPLCKNCYQAPKRRCGICGEERAIAARQADGQTDACTRCYRGAKGTCTVCGRFRHGRHAAARDGAFHCMSCWPRPIRKCDDCGEMKPGHTTWPIGDLCSGCYQRRTQVPAPCSVCGRLRVMVARGVGGGEICRACCGIDAPNSCCRQCKAPDDIYDDGRCPRCVLTDRVQDLLSLEDGTVPPPLKPLAAALTDTGNPYAALNWLRRSRSAKLLAELAFPHGEFTHDTLDALPQNEPTRYLRGLLVAAGVLPRRDENLARLELWLANAIGQLPSHQVRVIRAFGEWHVVRDARRRAARGRYTALAATGDIRDIKVAIDFMAWLDAHDIDLRDTAQSDLDRWLVDNSSLHRTAVTFIRWAVARRITSKLAISRPSKRNSSEFLDEQGLHDQLRRCLNDDTVPREARIIGALVRLYAVPVSRIVVLTIDRFHRDENGAYLTLDRHPVLLPPKLAVLIEEQIAQPVTDSRMLQQFRNGNGYLFPGKAPGRPRNVVGTHNLLNQFGLPVLSARNTAMIEAVTNLPPIVVADLFGMHPNTAQRWANYAKDDWSAYLSARMASDE
ncbi:XRE family transcriptional regulator [Streptomyces sp. MMS24-I29]|uniref:XRE family transcriptional regulator n=1 Tax=Streptomyces sp. MMS24-I29 TaxID=3351480 RepID=UPI003C7990E0